MSSVATPANIRQALIDRTEIALLDLRPELQFAEGHPLFAASLPVSRLELEVLTRVPYSQTLIVVYGSTPQETGHGIARLQELGYARVAALEGGVEGWRDAGYELFSDVNAPSKAFGELVAEELKTPFIEPQELRRMLDAGNAVTVLDGRPFDEYRTMSIPAAYNAPNATLVRYVGSLPNGDDLVVVNCAGRTRSIIGAQTLIHAALRPRVAALRNGTIGWTLAGLTLEHGQKRRTHGAVTGRAITASRRFADRAGVARVGLDEIGGFSSRQGTVYQFDVRSVEAFLGGHLPGFVSAPGGQLVQETDYYAPVRGATMILADDDGTEANVTAAWLAQMGWQVAVLDGVRSADGGAHGPGQLATPPLPDIGWISVSELASARQASRSVLVIDLDVYRNYTAEHIPGAIWGSRADLLTGSAVSVPRAETYVLTAREPVLIGFAVIDLDWLPGIVVGLQGGTDAWSEAALPLTSEGGQMLSTPRDRYRRPYEGTDVSEAAMRAYLEWEYGLVGQLERDGTHHFKPLRAA